ncbi:MAG: MFS transporter, partial [Acidobacteriota bacterium]|nr:MFS transporter [Acidobacteriota bacterium]
WAFLALGAMDLAIASILAWRLPVERQHHAMAHGILRGSLRHLRNGQLAATYLGAFCVLFTQVALLTYVTFYLAAPPYRLTAGELGAVYTVYLVGAAVTPIAGRGIDRYGHRTAIFFACVLCAGGALVALGAPIPALLAGLTMASSGVFIANAAATSYIGTVARENRALAVGIYVSCYYIGGSAGASGPGWIWQSYGWRGVVALIVCVQIALASIALLNWKSHPTPKFSQP